jgi:hypothetical protein
MDPYLNYFYISLILLPRSDQFQMLDLISHQQVVRELHLPDFYQQTMKNM